MGRRAVGVFGRRTLGIWPVWVMGLAKPAARGSGRGGYSPKKKFDIGPKKIFGGLLLFAPMYARI